MGATDGGTLFLARQIPGHVSQGSLSHLSSWFLATGVEKIEEASMSLLSQSLHGPT